MADNITIYYDYTCPYSYRVACWLRRLEEAGRELELEWTVFSLARSGGSCRWTQVPTRCVTRSRYSTCVTTPMTSWAWRRCWATALDTTRIYVQHSAEYLAWRLDRLALNAYAE